MKCLGYQGYFAKYVSRFLKYYLEICCVVSGIHSNLANTRVLPQRVSELRDTVNAQGIETVLESSQGACDGSSIWQPPLASRLYTVSAYSPMPTSNQTLSVGEPSLPLTLNFSPKAPLSLQVLSPKATAGMYFFLYIFSMIIVPEPTLANVIHCGVVLAMVVHCYLKDQFHGNFAYISVSENSGVGRSVQWLIGSKQISFEYKAENLLLVDHVQ